MPNAHHLHSVKAIRAHELRQALMWFPPPLDADRIRTVLEIGAGTGQQARAIQAEGYRVTAVDLQNSHYRAVRVFDVIDYDGTTIPAADGSVDIVFSSNVLEHVGDIDALLDEMRRVLADDGTAIHLIPSSVCRLWSFPAHYVWLARRVVRRLALAVRGSEPGEMADIPRTPAAASEWLRTLFPSRHGERGSALTEVWYFSRRWWLRKFAEHGFGVCRVEPNHLFYTMANSTSLGIGLRQRLSRILGSACTLYVLRKAAP